MAVTTTSCAGAPPVPANPCVYATTTFVGSSANLTNPWGLSLDGNGTLLIVDQGFALKAASPSGDVVVGPHAPDSPSLPTRNLPGPRSREAAERRQ